MYLFATVHRRITMALKTAIVTSTYQPTKTRDFVVRRSVRVAHTKDVVVDAVRRDNLFDVNIFERARKMSSEPQNQFILTGPRNEVVADVDT